MEPIRGAGDFPSLPDEADEVRAPEHGGEQAKPGPFSYSQESPVGEVTGEEELFRMAESLGRNVEEYASSRSGGDVFAPQHGNAEHAPTSEDATKWRERSINSSNIAEMISDHDPSMVKSYSYNLGGGHSAGLVNLKHSDSETEVLGIVTHPGGSGAGNTLMEKAVNESQKAGNKGVIHLDAEIPESIALYKKQGFRQQEQREGHFILDPSRSEHWHQQDGKWSMKHNEGKGYLTIPKTAQAPQEQKTKRRADDEETQDTKRQRLT